MRAGPAASIRRRPAAALRGVLVLRPQGFARLLRPRGEGASAWAHAFLAADAGALLALGGQDDAVAGVGVASAQVAQPTTPGGTFDRVVLPSTPRPVNRTGRTYLVAMAPNKPKPPRESRTVRFFTQAHDHPSLISPTAWPRSESAAVLGKRSRTGRHRGPAHRRGNRPKQPKSPPRRTPSPARWADVEPFPSSGRGVQQCHAPTGS